MVRTRSFEMLSPKMQHRIQRSVRINDGQVKPRCHIQFQRLFIYSKSCVATSSFNVCLWTLTLSNSIFMIATTLANTISQFKNLRTYWMCQKLWSTYLGKSCFFWLKQKYPKTMLLTTFVVKIEKKYLCLTGRYVWQSR